MKVKLEEVIRDLDLRGLHFCEDLAEEGTGWEVAAEPEPQYFETLREAIDFRDSLKDEPVTAQDRGAGRDTVQFILTVLEWERDYRKRNHLAGGGPDWVKWGKKLLAAEPSQPEGMERSK